MLSALKSRKGDGRLIGEISTMKAGTCSPPKAPDGGWNINFSLWELHGELSLPREPLWGATDQEGVAGTSGGGSELHLEPWICACSSSGNAELPPHSQFSPGPCSPKPWHACAAFLEQPEQTRAVCAAAAAALAPSPLPALAEPSPLPTLPREGKRPFGGCRAKRRGFIRANQ